MKKQPRLLTKPLVKIALLLLVATATLTQQSCFTITSELFGDSDEENTKNQYGQSITFSDCSIEMNAKDDNGKNRLAYHFTAELSGMKEQGVQMILSIESPKGTPHTYVDAEGDAVEVRAKKDFKNKNQTNSFSLKNKSVGIENSKLHLKKGENTYYVRLTAYDENNHALIGSSPYLAVTMTGNSNASATFSNCKIEHNVEYNDKKMLKFSYHYNIQGANGHEVQMILSVESPKGTPHYKSNGNPLENRGKTFTVNSDNYEKDAWAGLYHNTLNPKPGKNTYYVRMTAKDLTTGKTIGESDYISYTQTGSSNNNKNNSNNNKNKNSNKNSSSKKSSKPSGSFSNCRVEPNVIQDGGKALLCHYTINANGVKGHNLKLVISIESPKGIDIHVSKINLTCNYDSTVWNDRTTAIGNHKFVKPGEKTYYVRYMLYDETLGTTLASTQYMSFTMTGAYG